MGVPDPVGTLHFTPVNPLQFWATDGTPGIVRPTRFDTQTQPAFVLSEAATLALGGQNGLYEAFRGLEGNPHGTALTHFANPEALSRDDELTGRIEQLRTQSPSREVKQATASYISKHGT